MAAEGIVKKHEDLRNLVWQYLLANGLSVRKLSQSIDLPYYSLYRFLHGKTHKYPRKNTLHALEELVKSGDNDYEPPQEHKDNKALLATKNHDTVIIFEIFNVISDIVNTKGLSFRDYNQAWEVIKTVCEFYTQAGRKEIDKELVEFMLRKAI